MKRNVLSYLKREGLPSVLEMTKLEFECFKKFQMDSTLHNE